MQRKQLVTPARSATAPRRGTHAPTQEEPVRIRPRVEGEREREILDAALVTLAEHGYDRFSFDTVAGAAKASKATLYRRWPTKVDLVVDALQLMIGVDADRYPDTGTLRGDLIAQACAKGGLADDRAISVFASLLNAMHRDVELHQAIIKRLIEPKMAASIETFRAAQRRGEIGKGADLELLARLLPALSIHEAMLTGLGLSRERLVTLVDSVVLPACAATLQRH
jgi:AcrR family transcriptional regulator